MHPRATYVLVPALLVFAFLLFSLPHSPVHPSKLLRSPTNSEVLSPNSIIGHYVSPQAKPAHDNVVIYMLVPPKRLEQLADALRTVENSFNRRFKYPYVLFMTEEELREVTDEMRGRMSGITDGRLTFAALRKEDWAVPDGLDPQRIEWSFENIGFDINYRAMCRFNSGLFYHHPALAKYDWFWRLDSDIEFTCNMPYNPIQRMIDANATYGFVQIARDYLFVQPTLAPTVSQFVAQHKSLIPLDANLGFGWNSSESVKKLLDGQAGNEDWIMSIIYNNFEISHRSIWESELYKKFFDYLDRAGGFFYERWGDAPVHSLGISMMLRKDQVMHFGNEVGYHHPRDGDWPYGCETSSPLCGCTKDGRDDFYWREDEWFNAPEYHRS